MATRRRSHGRTRAREIPALLFAFVWLLGFEVAPLAHVALHASLAPHSHETASSSHCHEGFCHEEAPSDRASASSDPLAHGQHSLEHRGVAALTPDLTVFVAQLTPIAELAELVAPPARVTVVAASRPPARAPPA